MCPLSKVAQPAPLYGLAEELDPDAEELDPDAAIHLARSAFLSELPGIAYGLITLVYLVTKLIDLS